MAPEPAREDAEQRIGGSQRGHPTEREFDTPFITGERVQSVKKHSTLRTEALVRKSDRNGIDHTSVMGPLRRLPITLVL